MNIACYTYNNGSPQLSGVVDDFTSFTFERSYSGIGEWQIVIPSYKPNATLLKEADFIKCGKGIAGLITKINQVKNETEETLTVSGVELKGIAEKRIVIPPSGSSHLTYTGTPEEVIQCIIENQITNPSKTNRRISGSIVLDNVGTNTMSYEGRFSSVSEDIITICETYYIGWYADIEDGQIVWHIYRGLSRGVTQSTNSRFIISPEYDSIGGSSMEYSIYKVNSVFIAGQGEGVDRVTKTYNRSTEDTTGLNRNEVYIDARDIADESLLQQRANEKLSEYGTHYVYEIVPSNAYIINNYRSGYDLGDVGSIKEGDTYSAVRLTSIIEVYENNQFSLSFTFGYDTNTLEGVFKRMRSNTEALISKEA